ncbi:MAG TPA: hypothetical protein VES20_10750, partial [Bryobacteraceae bacterium]|nr:hypothetical protein [Bryobacteraceae bacterium]
MARAVKLRVATWILGGLLGIVVLLIALLHTPPVRRYALKQAMEILGRQGIRFSAADFDYNLLELTATLNNVEVRSPQQPDLPPLLEARSVRVDLSLRKLISGEYHIEDAVARDPRLHVYITKDGRDNIPRPPTKEPTGKKTEYLIDKLLIEGGSLRYQDEKQGLDARLPLARVTIDGDPASGNHAIDLYTSAAGTLTYGGNTLPLRNVGASVLLEDDAANIRKLNVGIGDSAATLSGRIDRFDDPRFDLRADSTLSLDSLRPLTGLKQNASGTVHVALAAQGPLADIKARATVDGQDLTLDRFKDVDLKAEAEYQGAASRVKLESLNVVSPSGTIRGTADLALKPEAGTSTANLAASGLDLQQLSTMFKAPVRLASRADAKIAARWPAMQYEKASGDASINLTATRAAVGRDVLPLAGRLNAKTEGNRIVIGVPELRAAGSVVRGTVTLVNQQNLSGQLRVEATDLAQTVSAAETFLGRDVVQTPVAGSATVVADLRGTVKNPAVQATIQGTDLQVGQLTGATLTARADYNGTRARI